MFYVIYIAVIVFALYLIFHDRPKVPERREPQRPQTPQVPQVPQTPARPQAPAVSEVVVPKPEVRRSLSWTYLSSLEYDEGCGWGVGPDMDTMRTEITGMRYHCSLSDVGPVNGFVKPEPENEHDPDAQVVVRADGKVLGYIPKVALPEYADFNRRGLTCPFAGYVKVSRQGYLWADILVALPTNRSFAESALTAYLEEARQGEA